MSASSPPTAKPSAFLLGLWLLPATLMVIQMQATAYIDGRPFYPWRATIPALVEWLIWIPCTPIVLALARRFPLVPRPRISALVVHAAGIVAASTIRGLTYVAATLAFGRVVGISVGAYLQRTIVGWLPIAVLVYGAIVAAAIALDYARLTRERELQTARLSGDLARAELGALRSQLHPHFLFNALHSIGALVRAREVDSAVNTLATLSELLRELLTRRRADEVPLGVEIAFTQRYLEIEGVRFQDRLRVEWHVDENLSSALVPSLLLQPLVENAIRHGISKRTQAGRVVLTVQRVGEFVDISVVDDGAGFDSSASPSEGVGLSTTRARLAQMYGAAASLTLTNVPEGGAVARARVPYRV